MHPVVFLTRFLGETGKERYMADVVVGSEYEVGFEFPREITNEIEVRYGDCVIMYRGTAFGLYLDGIEDVRGGARIEKFEKTTVARPPKKKWSFWPFSYTLVPQSPTEKFRCVWEIEPHNKHFYYVFDRRICTEMESYQYRGGLAAEATAQNIILTQKLLNELFGPIDAKIAEMRAQVEKMASAQ